MTVMDDLRGTRTSNTKKPQRHRLRFERTLQGTPLGIIPYSISVIRELPVTLRLYPSEVLKQAGLIVLSSALVLWGMEAVFGAVLGVV